MNLTITNGTAVERLVILADASPAECVASEFEQRRRRCSR